MKLKHKKLFNQFEDINKRNQLEFNSRWSSTKAIIKTFQIS